MLRKWANRCWGAEQEFTSTISFYFPFSFSCSVFPSQLPLLHASLLLSTPTFLFFFPCLPLSPSFHLPFSLCASPLLGLANGCPPNGLSEEKTDLNEEWRQKMEQRGSKRRFTQRKISLLEMHSLYVRVFFLCVCVQGSLLYSGQQSKTRE